MRILGSNLLIILILFIFNLIASTCVQAQNDEQILQSALKKKSNENLYSKEKAISILTEKYKLTKKFDALDYKTELKLIYSVAMYGDSLFSIRYQPPYFEENGGVWFHEDINSEEWLTVKNEIIEIYKRIGFVPCEAVTKTNTNTNIIDANFEIRYQLNEKMPFLSFYSISYEFLEELSKLEGKILGIESDYENMAMEIFKRRIEKTK